MKAKRKVISSARPNAPRALSVRVFLSSTFRDFGEERDFLVLQVFPALSAKLNDRIVEIVDVALSSSSATSAASRLGIKYSTFRIHAKRLGVFNTNQSGKGIPKPISDERKIPLNEIIEGKHPQYQSNKLRIRLLKEGVKEHKCENCGLTEWLGKKISLELDHIDGDRLNNKIENLRPATRSQNLSNKGLSNKNTSGAKNVSWCKERNKWEVQMYVNKKKTFVGRFDSLEVAKAAATAFRTQHLKEFANHG